MESMRKILKNTNSQKGFTLLEMLVTVVVMLMVTAIIILCVQLSTKYYKQSVKQSESYTICSELAAAIQEELQYATKIQPVDTSALDAEGYYTGFTYYSRARQHGSNSSIVCDEGKIYVRKGGNDYGIVGSETYTYDMKADLRCRWHPNGFFQVELKMMSGETVMAEESFRVNPLNKGF